MLIFNPREEQLVVAELEIVRDELASVLAGNLNITDADLCNMIDFINKLIDKSLTIEALRLECLNLINQIQDTK